MRVANAGRGIIADAPFRVSVELARWMRRTLMVQGFVRSMPHAYDWSPGWLEILEAEELGELTADGFGVAGYQIFRGVRQQTYEHGQACGEALAEHAASIGYPPGATLWFDAEAFRPHADCEGVIRGWRQRVAYHTDSRGVYNGSNFWLPNMDIPAKERSARIQGDRLYGLKGINLYWDAMSQVNSANVRHHCLGQIWEYVLWGDGPDSWWVEEFRPSDPKHKAAKRFDLNASRRDSLGGRMRWAVA